MSMTHEARNMKLIAHHDYQPTEVASFVPAIPDKARANGVNDVYVDENRIIYAIDRLLCGCQAPITEWTSFSSGGVHL